MTTRSRDLAREIGSAQDDISDLAEGIDPSDPDVHVDPFPEGEIDPGDPEGDIDPSDPDSNPGEFDPDQPEAAEPGADNEPEAGDEIDLPAPAEPEEGGFAETRLLPDPVPLAGGWKVVNHPGPMTCAGACTIALKRRSQSTQLAVKQDGRVLKGPKLAPGAKKNIELTWQPESEAFTGVVTVAAPGGETRIRFYMRVVSPRKMKGEMVATVNVNAQGVSASCGGTREITLTHKEASRSLSADRTERIAGPGFAFERAIGHNWGHITDERPRILTDHAALRRLLAHAAQRPILRLCAMLPLITDKVNG